MSRTSHTKAIAVAEFDYGALDDVIHGKLRLGIMAYVCNVEHTHFTELQAKLQATSGNLSVALSRLEAAGYLKLNRTLLGKRTNTQIEATEAGRTAWKRYLDGIALLVGQAPK